MPYRRIVVGTDGSPTANVAVGASIRLARRCRAELLVVSATQGYGLTERALRDAWLEVAARTEKAKVQARFDLVDRAPGPALLETAEGSDADLIVLGNRGMGAATRVRLGSIPDVVAYAAPCDLLIVDTTRAEVGATSPPFRRLVAGTDGSPTASDAVRRAFDIAAIYGADVRLVFVGDPLVGAIRLEEAAAGAPEDVEVERVLEVGEPAERICDVADRDGADLVVVGNKGMSGLRRMLGSVPNAVAHIVPTNVLVVKTVDRTASDLTPGTGGVVDVDGRRLAVYVDADGTRTVLNPRCTHMGCTVGWNGTERTWDCPCHGSRYGVDGAVVHGPATKPLDPAS